MFDVEEYVEITTSEGAFRFDGTIHMRDARNLLIACPHEQAPHLRLGMRLQLAQLIGESFYQIETTILRCQQNYFVVGMMPPQLVQRRRNPRHACMISTLYTVESFPPHHIKELAAPRQGSIRDISMGGMKLVIGENVPAGTRLTVEANFEKVGTIVLPAEALRCKQMDSPSDNPKDAKQYQVSCRFINVSRIHQIQLHRYLMNQTAS